MKDISKVLIANRGEIACRIIQTCRNMGIKTVTLYTEGEEALPHRYKGDESLFLDGSSLNETYLNGDKIIELAKKVNADAIHPGYGFLSENASFATKVEKSKIKFVGPSPQSMELMGDKIESKKKIEEIGAPSVPGYHGKDQTLETLKKEANKIGYPVLIKASAGGGGKGMRVVLKESEFSDSLDSAKREALNAFGNDQVLIEKYIQNPRHIEVQVFGDQKGNVVHLFERECSIQRRHQKIIEESPSPSIKPEVREQICQTAVDIAKAINYVGAGTVEFMMEEDGSFYFLEMNTRLQVEHPVTEMVTGTDLVKWQIQVAENKEIPLKQNELVQKGHAIECRLYAEDPDTDFLPSIGEIAVVGNPQGRHTRLDTGYVAGNSVGINFDPMLAKLIVWGEDRTEALTKIKTSLIEVPFFGIKTNRSYLGRIIKHPKFVEGETYTHFVETHKEDLKVGEVEDKDAALAIATYYLCRKGTTQSKKTMNTVDSPWETLVEFRNV